MKTATRPEEQSRLRKANSSTEAPSKIARILVHLLTGSSTNRFEAECLGDHCLNSTIATLANRHGLNFQRQPERVPNRWGLPCLVTRYSLPASEHDKALMVLAYLKRTTRATAEG
ncbi:MAG: hypothetical protein ACOH2P_17565 [Pseudomonas sp.]